MFKTLRVLAVAGLACATFLAAAATAHAQVLRGYNAGQWTVVANARNGTFQNCTVTSNYGGNSRVLFMLTRQTSWGLGISNTGWNWNTGSRGQITYWVDNHAQRTSAAQALSRTSLVVMLDDSTALFQ